MTKDKLEAAHPTGRRRYRIGWFGRLILQIEIKHPKAGLFNWDTPGVPNDPWRDGRFTFWRDARPEDLMPIEHSPHIHTVKPA